MAEIQAFAGIRYNAAQGVDISQRIAPPYDILAQADKDRLMARNPHNIVEIDLPFVPPKSAGPPAVYQQAAEVLVKWRSDGVMVTETTPAVYVYHQRFTHDGSENVRRLFLSRMRIEEFGAGSVFPHEKTFGGPKEDRLALMKASRCQLSPIFGLYVDPSNEVADLLQRSVPAEPDVHGTLEDVDNRLWALTDPRVIEQVVAMMADKKVYIADGHHRYGTAALYRDWLAEQEDGLSDDHPARFVLVALAAMDDPGMLILPTHRVLVELSDDEIMNTWSAGLHIEPAEGSVPSADFELYSGRTEQRWSGLIRDRRVLAQLEPEAGEAWQGLDMAYLHRYLIEELFAGSLYGGREPKIRYLKTVGGAEGTAREERGLAIITRATTMEQLRAVSEAGGLMPQKSTYFFPKLATGMVVNSLY